MPPADLEQNNMYYIKGGSYGHLLIPVGRGVIAPRRRYRRSKAVETPAELGRLFQAAGPAAGRILELDPVVWTLISNS